MSDSPCTGCRSTRNGRLFFAYVNHYGFEDLEKRRVRLCQRCVAELLAPLLECADFLEGGAWQPFDLRPPQPAISESTGPVSPAPNSSPAALGTVTSLRRGQKGGGTSSAASA